MKNFIIKLKNIIEKLANNIELKSPKHNEFSLNEYVKLDLFESLFSFLVCQSENNLNFKESEIKNLFTDNVVIDNIQFSLDKKFEKKQENYDPDDALILKNIYREDEHFLYAYHKLEKNENAYVNHVIQLTKRFNLILRLPVFIKGNDKDKILALKNFSKNDSQIIVSAFDLKDYAVNKVLLLNKENQIAAKHEAVIFEWFDDDCLIAQNYHGSIVEKMIRDNVNIQVYNKNGLANLEHINYFSLLESVRHAIAHSTTMFHSFDENNQKLSMLGTTILMNEGKKYKQAITIPFVFGKSLAGLLWGKFDANQKKLSYLHSPKLENPIKTVEELEEYLKNCKIIEIKNFGRFDKMEIDAIIKELSTRYNEDDITVDLKDFIKETFEMLNSPQTCVGVSKMHNLTIPLSKIQNNPHFFADNNVYNKNAKTIIEQQQSYIKEFFEVFYGFDIVSSNSVSKSGKYTRFNLKNYGLAYIFDKIIAHLDDFVHGIPTKKMGVYRDEMMIFLAIFLAYLCLISNHLEEDLDEKTTSLSDVEYNNLQQKVKDLNMNDFSMIDNMANSKVNQKSPKTIKEKIGVIKTIRNTIAHRAIRIMFNKNGNLNETQLIFGYEETAKKYNMISLEKFFEFINNPLFVEYNKEKFNFLNFKNKEDLESFIQTKLQ